MTVREVEDQDDGEVDRQDDDHPGHLTDVCKHCRHTRNWHIQAAGHEACAVRLCHCVGAHPYRSSEPVTEPLDTDEYRAAVQHAECPGCRGAFSADDHTQPMRDWHDKPRRLVYQLCDEVDRLRAGDELVGITEISQRCRFSKQRANELSHDRDFPAPALVLAMGRVWHWDEVEAFFDRRYSKEGVDGV